MSTLVLDSASRWFGNVVAVNDVSLSIGPGVTGLISSVSLRRGFAVVGSVVALIVVSGVVTSVQAITNAQDADGIGVAAGLLSPWSIYSGLADAWHAGVVTFTPPGSAWALAYVLVAVVLTALCVLGLVARFRKVGSR